MSVKIVQHENTIARYEESRKQRKTWPKISPDQLFYSLSLTKNDKQKTKHRSISKRYKIKSMNTIMTFFVNFLKKRNQNKA